MCIFLRDLLSKLNNARWHLDSFGRQGVRYSWDESVHFGPIYDVFVNLIEAMLSFWQLPSVLLSSEELQRLRAVSRHPPETFAELLRTLEIVLQLLLYKDASVEVSMALYLRALSFLLYINDLCPLLWQ